MDIKWLSVLFLVAAMLFGSPVTEYARGEENAEKRGYKEIYPRNIVEAGPFYYFEEYDELLVRFYTILFDKYSLAGLIELFKKEGGLSGCERILDIGTGTGSLGFAAIAYGGGRVVGTELDPLAVKNARYNIKRFGLEDIFEVREVPFDSPSAYSVIKDKEKFDLIISDPPQSYDEGDRRPFPEAGWDAGGTREAFFTRDEGYGLLKSLVEGLRGRLNENGRALLMMKNPKGISMLKSLAAKNGIELKMVYSTQKELDPLDKRFIGRNTRMPNMGRNMMIFELRPEK
ncbi:MAG: methyltransferase domain-containing protein [Candidatus Omnitrophica bacterium]|nr:methyltransferase domain-containing protein [Candidatus Omnitrophota bacterium]